MQRISANAFVKLLIPVVEKLFRELAPKYDGVKGGYVRIYKLGPRRGDGAEVCMLELK